MCRGTWQIHLQQRNQMFDLESTISSQAELTNELRHLNATWTNSESLTYKFCGQKWMANLQIMKSNPPSH